MNKEWKKAGTHGLKGIIYAKGNERKIVTPKMTDFHYRFKPEAGQAQKARLKK